MQLLQLIIPAILNFSLPSTMKLNEKKSLKLILPSLCRSKPLADVARFFADPSPSSRSELRRVTGEMLVLQATFEIELALEMK